MSFDEIFDLTAGVYFNFYNIYMFDTDIFDLESMPNRPQVSCTSGLPEGRPDERGMGLSVWCGTGRWHAIIPDERTPDLPIFVCRTSKTASGCHDDQNERRILNIYVGKNPARRHETGNNNGRVNAYLYHLFCHLGPSVKASNRIGVSYTTGPWTLEQRTSGWVRYVVHSAKHQLLFHSQNEKLKSDVPCDCLGQIFDRYRQTHILDLSYLFLDFVKSGGGGSFYLDRYVDRSFILYTLLSRIRPPYIRVLLQQQ